MRVFRLRRGFYGLCLGLLGFSPVLVAGPILSIQPTNEGCLAVITNRAGGLYQACPPEWRFRPDTKVPEVLPVALAHCQGRLVLSSRSGIHARRPGEQVWEALTESASGPLNCRGANGVARPFGQGPQKVDGRTLQALPGRGLPEEPLQHLLVAVDGTIYGAGLGAGVFRLAAGDVGWRSLNEGLDNRQVLAMAQADDGTLFVGTFGAGVYRRSPDDNRWKPLATLAMREASALQVGGNGHNLLVAGRGEVWQSTDAGRNWSALPELAGEVILSFAEDSRGWIWAGSASGRLYRLNDQGWKSVRFGNQFIVHQLAGVVQGDLWVFMDGKLQHWHSADRRWRAIELPFEIAEGQVVEGRVRLVADHAGNLYVGAFNRPVQRWNAGASAWESADTGLPPRSGVRDLLAGSDGTLYAIAADLGRVYHRPRGSEQWAEIELDSADSSYQVNDLVELPGGLIVASGSRELVWLRPGRAWRHRWMAQLNRDQPGIDREHRLWTQRTRSRFGIGPGEDRFSEGQPAGAVYRDSVALGDDTEVALEEGGSVVRLAMAGDGYWEELARYPAPGAPPHTLALAGDSIYLGTADGLYRLDWVDGRWREVTPNP